MEKIAYDLTKLNCKDSEVKELINKMDYIRNGFTNIANTIDSNIMNKDNIHNEFLKVEKQLGALYNDTERLEIYLNEAIMSYKNSEKEIYRVLSNIESDLISNPKNNGESNAKNHKKDLVSISSNLDDLNQGKDKYKIKEDNSLFQKGFAVASADDSNVYIISNNSKKEGGKVVKNILESYSVDSGIYDINPKTGNLIFNFRFITTIDLTYHDDLIPLEDGMVETKYHVDMKTGEIFYNGTSTGSYVNGTVAGELRFHYPFENAPEDFIPKSALPDGELITYNTRYWDVTGYTHIKRYRDKDRYMQSTEKVKRHLYKHTFENSNLTLYELPDQPGAFSDTKNGVLNGKRIGIIDKNSVIEVDDGNGGKIKINAPLTTLEDVEDMDNDYTTLKKSWQWVKAGVSAVSDIVVVIKGFKIVKTGAKAFEIIDRTGKYAGKIS